MGPRRFHSMTGACVFLLLASACSAATSDRTTDDESSRDGSQGPTIVSAKNFSLSRFDDSTDIDNKWFPLQPGTQYILQGSAVDDGERINRQVIFTVTDLTKVIAGVRTRVVWDRDYDDGELVESELAFFAQDIDGNVWHLGQYPEEYDDGELEKAPAWIEGQAGARAGLAMKAEPSLGTPSYAQGYAPPPLYWDDRARVHKADQSTCVPQDCYDEVLVMEEFEQRKPGAFQLKYYAPDVGNVRIGWRGPKEKEKETLVLTDLVHLGAKGLESVRQKALMLEERAYRISKVYRQTPPSKPS